MWETKKAHLATWDDKDIESINEEKKEEEAFIYLMTMECENIRVDDSDYIASNDDIDDLYSEIYEYLIKDKKNVNLSKKIIATLEIDINGLQKENKLLKKRIESLDISSKVCQICETLKAKVEDLSKPLEKFTNGKNNLVSTRRIRLWAYCLKKFS